MSLDVSSKEFEYWVDSDSQKVILDLMYKIWDGIIMRTPVRTGQARASWNMSKGSPDFSTVDEGEGLAPPPKPSVSIKDGEYPEIFIANGKRYINYLEFGASTQAPAGMVQVTIDSLEP